MNRVELEGEVVSQEERQGRKNIFYLTKVQDEEGNYVTFVTWRMFERGTWLQVRGHLESDDRGYLRLCAEETEPLIRVGS